MPVKNRFTPAQIVELRNRRAAGESLQSLAEAFKTIPQYVSSIATGRIHQAIGGPITKPMEVNAAERQIEFNGIKLSETKWAERVGLPLSALKTRLHRGWSIQDALTIPLQTAPSEILTLPGPSIAYVALNDVRFFRSRHLVSQYQNRHPYET